MPLKLLSDLKKIHFEEISMAPCLKEVEEKFPLTAQKPVLKQCYQAEEGSRAQKVGVVFSGGPASGGHNVICGIFDALKELHPASCLYGFLNGFEGILKSAFKELTSDLLLPYRNQGGFDLIGSGRFKIKGRDQMQMVMQSLQSLSIDALVVIGGDDSNTNAAVLAEFFLASGCPIQVIGVPKTIDGDLKNGFVTTSFGFDTATKLYAQLIGNIARDALSSKKYYHFIKLMGRTASHIALECALRTHPNYTLISEEKKSLSQIVISLAEMVELREKEGKNYGVVLIPEGIIEFMQEISCLLTFLSKNPQDQLSAQDRQVWDMIPQGIQRQLLNDRDPHGNIDVSSIQTEQLLIECVKKELEKRAFKGSFKALAHFYGYEGRCSIPSVFDATYGYTLGQAAALLLSRGATSYMCFVSSLNAPSTSWSIGGVPLTSLLHLEKRGHESVSVIKKALVDREGDDYKLLKAHEKAWMLDDDYRYPGPVASLN